MNRSLLAFLRKELLQTLRDPRMRVILFVMPIVQMTVFGLALSTEVRDIPLRVVREPGDSAMARLEERFYASGWFVPAEDPDATLIAPKGGLLKAMARGQGDIQFLVDATNAAKARAIESYANAVLAGFLKSELGPEEAGPSIALDVRVLYNPAMESAVFMVPGVMSMILCLVTIVLTSMSFAREREGGTFETIVSAPLENWEILLGKTLPYILLGLVDAVLVIAAGVVLFSVPLRGPVWMLGLSALVFIVTTVSVGTLISTVADSQQQAMLGGFLFLFPAILMSGIMFPVENMPPAIAWVAHLDPLMYFVRLLRNVLLKGGDAWVAWSNLAVLAAMACGAAVLAFKRFRQTLN